MSVLHHCPIFILLDMWLDNEKKSDSICVQHRHRIFLQEFLTASCRTNVLPELKCKKKTDKRVNMKDIVKVICKFLSSNATLMCFKPRGSPQGSLWKGDYGCSRILFNCCPIILSSASMVL